MYLTICIVQNVLQCVTYFTDTFKVALRVENTTKVQGTNRTPLKTELQEEVSKFQSRIHVQIFYEVFHQYLKEIKKQCF